MLYIRTNNYHSKILSVGLFSLLFHLWYFVGVVKFALAQMDLADEYVQKCRLCQHGHIHIDLHYYSLDIQVESIFL